MPKNAMKRGEIVLTAPSTFYEGFHISFFFKKRKRYHQNIRALQTENREICVIPKKTVNEKIGVKMI